MKVKGATYTYSSQMPSKAKIIDLTRALAEQGDRPGTGARRPTYIRRPLKNALMKKSTTEDARLMLEMFRGFDTPENNAAMKWFMKEFSAKDYKEFKKKYPRGSDGLGYVSRILGQFEIAGVLISHGHLNENLYFDMSAIGFLWPRFENIIPGWQKEAGPALWENAVWLAECQKKWAKEVWKPGLKWKSPPK